ncbi:MAG TPA: hypothetical protein ENG83_12965 [Nitrospirae bacterium]|nr:hypothetical protein BMS3Abin06_02658 [bacterium BMS3Abin06]HDH13088.1 hypothetical protein [Nitrospirota bacterium]HDZ02892.1 hypothetical protein [Nitrospirota bacterium]
MKQKFETIIKHLTGAAESDESPVEIQIPAQFRPGEEESTAISRNLNAAFLIALSGETHPLYSRADNYLRNFEAHPSWEIIVRFYREGLELIHSEISNRCYDDEHFGKDLTALYSWLINPENLRKKQETIEKISRLFFPEGVSLSENREENINALREKRKVNISKLNPDPITDPAKEILFTSNILITIPPASKGINDLPLSSSLKRMLDQIAGEEQLYWYDHPIPVGVSPEQNEVLYGLAELDKAVEFEKQSGTMDGNAVVTCLLSVSVTHEGLQGIVKEYLEHELKKEKKIRHLEVYLFTEADSIRLIEEILVPAAQRYTDIQDFSRLYEVIGVDGEYGRHYSFLKAIAAFWQVFISREIKGTFKIDLDQVFPQKELVEQSGSSAFEHFRTPLWGAEGIDNEGNKVELGMIAGALVNQKDIGKSLFTPDVPFPEKEIKGDELIFFSALPQALSTEAEMMTRYTDGLFDGKNQCIQRIHVTGGTSGILVDSLRKYQPFTPTFIGRAEDQSYILSVLFEGNQNKLRYVHKAGLIMQHDKEAFAWEAIKMSATGKLIGDYIRILMFSYYVKALPWSFEKTKDIIDPFTGCFVSRIPLTVVYLRFALKAASFFNESSDEKKQQGFEFLQSGIRRLHETIRKLTKEPNPLIEQFRKEKQAWNIYYEVLASVETEIKRSDAFALELQEKAKSLVETCKINFE